MRFKTEDMLAPILLLLFFGVESNGEDYERDQVQKLYPGFGDKYIFFPGENGTEIVGRFDRDANGNGKARTCLECLKVGEEDVYFIYYSRNIQNGVVVKTEKDLARYVYRSKKIKFVTHGWLASSKSEMCKSMVSAYLKQSEEVNVVVMDWSAVSGNFFYVIPMILTTKIGERYSRFLNYLVEKSGVDPANIHMIGHSLGAHISGFAARGVRKGKIGRITGLDPAGPGFVLPLVDFGLVEGGYLQKTDAQFVDVIHTCAGYLGMTMATGHADFYPNGGGPAQPGCSILKFIESCSHGKAFKYFTSSILLPEKHMVSRCSSLMDFSKRYCTGEIIPMGDSTPTNATGIYYGIMT